MTQRSDWLQLKINEERRRDAQFPGPTLPWWKRAAFGFAQGVVQMPWWPFVSKAALGANWLQQQASEYYYKPIATGVTAPFWGLQQIPGGLRPTPQGEAFATSIGQATQERGFPGFMESYWRAFQPEGVARKGYEERIPPGGKIAAELVGDLPFIIPAIQSAWKAIKAYRATLTPDKARRILGVRSNATGAELDAAFRKLARKYHPDVSTLRNAETKFKEVGAAYDLLTNRLAPIAGGQPRATPTSQLPIGETAPTTAITQPTNLGIADVSKVANQRIGLASQGIVSSVKQVPPKQPPITTFETPEKLPFRATGAARQFFTRTYRPQRIFEYIDGGKRGAVTEAFYGTMDKARSAVYGRVTNDLDGMRQALKDNGLKYTDMLKNRQIIYNAAGEKFSLDLDQRIGTYIYSQNAKAMNHLAGMGLDKAAVTQVITSLTPQEGAYAKWLMGSMQRLEPEVAKVTQNVLNRKFSPVDHYFRLMVSNPDVIDMPVKVPTVGGFAPEEPSIPKGFTKARKGSFEQVRLRATEIYIRHMQQAENFIQMQPVARDLARLLHKPEILSIFRNARMPLHKAEDLTKIVHDWLKDSTSTNPNAPRSYLERAIRKFRVNAVTAVLGFNVVTSMKQFPSFVTGSTEVGVIPAMKGLFKFLANPSETKEIIKTYSPQIYKRVIEREIKEMETTRGIIAGKLSKRQIAMIMTTSMDRLAVSSLYRGAFDDFLRKNPEKFEGAAKYAENAIIKTQPIYEAKDLAALWRTGEMGKIFTMFQNQLNQNWNYLMFDVIGKAKMGTIGKAEAIRRIFLAYIVPGTLIGMIAKSRIPRDTKDLAGDLTDQIIANVPIFGAMALSVLRGFDVSPGIAFEPLQQAGYAGEAIQRMVKEPTTEHLTKTVRQTLIAIGYLTGTPTGQVKRVADSLIKQAEGNLDDWMEYVWGQYIRGQAKPETKPTGKSRWFLPATGGSSTPGKSRWFK